MSILFTTLVTLFPLLVYLAPESTKIEPKISGKIVYLRKENKAQNVKFLLICIIWVDSMTLKMTSPTIYLFIFNLKYVVETFI